MKKWIVLICFLVGVVFGYLLTEFCRAHNKDDTGTIVSDTITVCDTISYYEPTPKDSFILHYEKVKLPTLNENLCQRDEDTVRIVNDSAVVEIPIEQKVYNDSTYKAYVSGYHCNLDSIFVYPRITTIRQREEKPPNKWSIGINAGYGFTNKGMTPYIGIGVSYSIFSF